MNPQTSPRNPAHLPVAGGPTWRLPARLGPLILALLGALFSGCGASYAGDGTPDLGTLLRPDWEQDLPTGAGPSALAVLDANGDGRLDVAVANGVDGTVRLYLQNDGRLLAGADYSVGRGPAALVALHLDDDNRLDLVVANAADSTLSTLLTKGQPMAGFAPGPLLPIEDNPSTLAVGDLTGDGIDDVLVGCAGSESVVALENKRQAGTLTKLSTLSRLSSVRALALVPLDAGQPKRLDLAVARADREEIALFQNDGRGAFAQSPMTLRLPAGSTPVALVAGNLDDDAQARSDLAILDHGNGDVHIAQSLGPVQFRLASYHVGEKPAALALGQLDSDARPELALTDPSGERVGTLLGSSDAAGSPLPIGYYAAPGLPAALAIADIDGDSLGELVVLCRAAGLLRVLSPQRSLR